MIQAAGIDTIDSPPFDNLEIGVLYPPDEASGRTMIAYFDEVVVSAQAIGCD